MSKLAKVWVLLLSALGAIQNSPDNIDDLSSALDDIDRARELLSIELEKLILKQEEKHEKTSVT